MVFVDLMFAFVLALLLALLLVGLFGWRHPRHPGARTATVFLFFLLLAAVWAGGVWSAPYGPVIWGGYWLPFLIVGLFLALIILAVAEAAIPPRARRPVEPPPEGEPADVGAATGIAAVFGLFFWLLLIGAIIAIIVRYMN